MVVTDIFDMEIKGNTPIYKQLIARIEECVLDGRLKSGDSLPSMNELSERLDISKETVKKVYSLLRERGFVESVHGKGFFVSTPRNGQRLKIFMLLDKLSNYKQILYDSFMAQMGDRAEVTIYLYNQHIELFEEFIDGALDDYDYYIVTPHFRLDSDIQHRAIKALKRIPNRKLVVLDNLIRTLPGNFGAVYQDMGNDIYDCLGSVLEDLRRYERLNVVILPSSLYGQLIVVGIDRFCREQGIEVEYFYDISAEMMHKGGLYLLLNGQLGIGLVEIQRRAQEQGLEIGKDIGVISYNESYLSEVLLSGLTTVSTDFEQMGRVAAEMILSHDLHKVKCNFRITRRNTF